MSAAVPTFDEGTNKIDLPQVDGIVYTVGGQPVEGSLEIKRPTTVRVNAAQGFVLDKSVQKQHVFVPGKKGDAEKAESDKSSSSNAEGDKAKDADPVQTDAGGPAEAPATSFGRTRP